MKRPCPTIITQSLSRMSGCLHPNAFIELAIFSSWKPGCSLAFFSYFFTSVTCIDLYFIHPAHHARLIAGTDLAIVGHIVISWLAFLLRSDADDHPLLAFSIP